MDIRALINFLRTRKQLSRVTYFLIAFLLQEAIDRVISHSSHRSSLLQATNWVLLQLFALAWPIATVLRLRDLKWPIWLACAFAVPWLFYSWVESNPSINGTVDLTVFVALGLTQAPLVFLPAKITERDPEAVAVASENQ